MFGGALRMRLAQGQIREGTGDDLWGGLTHLLSTFSKQPPLTRKPKNYRILWFYLLLISDQTNIYRDIRDGNWLSSFFAIRGGAIFVCDKTLGKLACILMDWFSECGLFITYRRKNIRTEWLFKERTCEGAQWPSRRRQRWSPAVGCRQSWTCRFSTWSRLSCMSSARGRSFQLTDIKYVYMLNGPRLVWLLRLWYFNRRHILWFLPLTAQKPLLLHFPHLFRPEIRIWNLESLQFISCGIKNTACHWLLFKKNIN